jgi:hypothetical protein
MVSNDSHEVGSKQTSTLQKDRKKKGLTKCWVNATVVELTSYLTGGAVEATPVGQAVTARAGWETELLSQARPVATGIEEAASRPCLEATKQQTS